MTGDLEIDADIARARTLPGAFYTESETYEALIERVLARAWHLVGHASVLGAPGSAKPLTLLPGSLDEPLLVTRDEGGEARVLSNVCPHRACLVRSEAGPARGLTCRYHGRRFDLEGRCLGAPELEEAPGFPRESDHLARLPLESLGPFRFTALDAAVPFEAWTSGVRDALGAYWEQDFVHSAAGSATYDVAAHWALYVDNYLEGFHIPFVHPELNKAVLASTYACELHDWSNAQVAEARPGDPTLPAEFIGREGVAAYYAWLFPHLMLNAYPWGVSVNIVEPLGPARTRVRFERYVARPELLERGAGGVVEAVQRGVRSRLYGRGRFSARSERGVHQFHRLLAAALE